MEPLSPPVRAIPTICDLPDQAEQDPDAWVAAAAEAA